MDFPQVYQIQDNRETVHWTKPRELVLKKSLHKINSILS